ncbi:unnamed protein product [Rhizophagus irregularis]|nr:unnamed protein product [Rhizophagus irregularis]
MLGINDPDIMSLWKVDIAKSEEYQLKDVNNYIVDIEDKLDDVKLSPDRMLENYFSVIPITTIIHIIVHVPTAAAKSRFEPPKTLEEIIKSITKGLRKRDPKLSDKLDMPLQQRDFKSVVERIRESVYGNIIVGRAAGYRVPIRHPTDDQSLLIYFWKETFMFHNL